MDRCPCMMWKNKKMQAEGNDYFKHAFSLYTDLIIGGYSPSDLETDSIGGGFETGKFATALCATWDINSWEELIGDSFKWDVVQVTFQYRLWPMDISCLHGWNGHFQHI